MNRIDTWNLINQNLSGLMFNLHNRWQSEKEHEDITDYLKVIKEYVPDAYAMTSKPFGVKVLCNDGILIVSVIKKGSYLQLWGKI